MGLVVIEKKKLRATTWLRLTSRGHTKVPAADPTPELEEQLDWEPPELAEEVPSELWPFPKRSVLADMLGPEVEALLIASGEELVEALELVEQLPDLPVTLVGEFVLWVFEELLQLICFYNIVVRGWDCHHSGYCDNRTYC